MSKPIFNFIAFTALFTLASTASANHINPITPDIFTPNHFDYGNQSTAYNRHEFKEIYFDEFWKKDFFIFNADNISDTKQTRKTLKQIFKRLKKQGYIIGKFKEPSRTDSGGAGKTKPSYTEGKGTDNEEPNSTDTNDEGHVGGGTGTPVMTQPVVAAVPEPSSLAILLLGIAGLTASRKLKSL